MSGMLEGKRVLVAEDRSAIAMTLCDAIEDAGGVVIGPAARLAHARRLASESEVDVGVLDVDLAGELCSPAAATLRERGVPVVLLTGFGAQSLPPELANLEVLEKPVDMPRLVEALAGLSAARSTPSATAQ